MKRIYRFIRGLEQRSGLRSPALCAPTAAVLVLAGCGAPGSNGAVRDVEPPPLCESVDRQVEAGETARVCVLIGRGGVVRLKPGGASSAEAVVCNRSDVERVWVSWSERAPSAQGAQAAETIWKEGGARRQTLPGHACARVGPAAAVMLRGWRDGGQGYDIGTEWEGTVRFRGARALGP